jgi:hypothetical protein
MNRSFRTVLSASFLIAFAGLPVLAQSVISAHSGLIHYVEGRVLLDGKPVEVKLTAFPELKEKMELRTEDGRAEVLLNPGVFLRLGENSAVRMVTNKLSDSQMEFLSGSAVIEADSALVQKENSVTIVYKGSAVHPRKSGIYRFDSQPAQLRVLSGEAEVDSGSNVLIVKAGKMVSLDGAVAVEKFNAKEGDALNRWSQRRAEYISMANISAAKYVSDSGRTWGSSGWFYNPYFGMFTYIPMNGMFNSPYGYRYYAPGVVYRVYQAPQVYAPMNGGGSNLGYSGGMAQAPVRTMTADSPATSRGGMGAMVSGSGSVSHGSPGGQGGHISSGGGAAASRSQ